MHAWNESPWMDGWVTAVVAVSTYTGGVRGYEYEENMVRTINKTAVSSSNRRVVGHKLSVVLLFCFQVVVFVLVIIAVLVCVPFLLLLVVG